MRTLHWLRELDTDARLGRLWSRNVVVAPLLLLTLPVVAGALGFLVVLFVGLWQFSPSTGGQVPEYDVCGPYLGALSGAAVGLAVALVRLWRRRR